jgi:hypothetical protein
MSEIARLNLSGLNIPQQRNKSYAEQLNENSNAILRQALGMYQLKGAQENMRRAVTSEKADEWIVENSITPDSQTIDIMKPSTWGFKDPMRNKNILADYKQKVGGSYDKFGAFMQYKRGQDIAGLKNSMRTLIAEAGTDEDKIQEMKAMFSQNLDNMSELDRNALFSYADEELYTMIRGNYIPEDERGPGFFTRAGDTISEYAQEILGIGAGAGGLYGGKKILNKARAMFGENQAEIDAENKKINEEIKKKKAQDSKLKKNLSRQAQARESLKKKVQRTLPKPEGIRMGERTFTSRDKVKQLGERVIDNAVKKTSKSDVVKKLVQAINKVKGTKPIMLGGARATGQLALRFVPVVNIALTVLTLKQIVDALSENTSN